MVGGVGIYRADATIVRIDVRAGGIVILDRVVWVGPHGGCDICSVATDVSALIGR